MFLGIDLGTSEVKLLLLAEDGRIVDQAGAALTVSRPQPLWSEQDPHSWWLATQQAVAQLRASQPQAWGQIRGIGLSGQMHGAVLVDSANQVLRPAILWNDGRSHAECEELMARVPDLPQLAGNLAMPGFTAPKLLWVQRHEPDIFRQVDCVLLPKDFLRCCLTGERVSEPSDAAGTLWLDVAGRCWNERLLAACGLSERQMPRLVESTESSGCLKPELAQAWGLSPNVVVAGGAGDNAASAIGIGATQPGEGFISLGTSGVLFLVTDQHRPHAQAAVHAFCHAWPQRWHQMSVMLSAASALKWFTHFSGATDEAALLAETAGLTPAERLAAPVFLPYLAGERTPHNDPFATGLLFGLSAETRRAQGAWAVLEGVAFGMADGLAALRASGSEVGRLALVGGGARSPMWAQLMADVLAVPVDVLQGASAGAALGAARLGGLAAGADSSLACQRPAVAQAFEPDLAWHAALLPRLERYRQLYPRLASLTRPPQA